MKKTSTPPPRKKSSSSQKLSKSVSMYVVKKKIISPFDTFIDNNLDFTKIKPLNVSAANKKESIQKFFTTGEDMYNKIGKKLISYLDNKDNFCLVDVANIYNRVVENVNNLCQVYHPFFNVPEYFKEAVTQYSGYVNNLCDQKVHKQYFFDYTTLSMNIFFYNLACKYCKINFILYNNFKDITNFNIDTPFIKNSDLGNLFIINLKRDNKTCEHDDLLLILSAYYLCQKQKKYYIFSGDNYDWGKHHECTSQKYAKISKGTTTMTLSHIDKRQQRDHCIFCSGIQMKGTDPIELNNCESNFAKSDIKGTQVHMCTIV